jgi:hypothetical protein
MPKFIATSSGVLAPNMVNVRFFHTFNSTTAQTHLLISMPDTSVDVTEQ